MANNDGRRLPAWAMPGYDGSKAGGSTPVLEISVANGSRPVINEDMNMDKFPPVIDEVAHESDSDIAGLVDRCEALVLNEAESSCVALDMAGSALEQVMPKGGGLLLSSLYSIRPYNQKALERMMISVWRPVYGVRMEEVEPNLQIFSFGNKVDMARVLADGPWRFDDHFLLLKEIPDPSQSDRELLRGLPIWVQMYDVPLMWRTVNSAKAIGKKLGIVLSVDPDSEGFNGMGFLRARIEIDVAEPLPRKITVSLGQDSRTVKFKFERLPNFCYNCGMLDHTEEYCDKPPLVDDKGNVVRWGEELRGFPPRKPRRAPPVPVRQSSYQKQSSSLAPSHMVRLPVTALLDPPATTGREPFKRKRMSPAATPRSSSANMEGLEVDGVDAGSRPSA